MRSSHDNDPFFSPCFCSGGGRRFTGASGSGTSALRGPRRGSGRPTGSTTGGGHSGHSANSGDSLADDDDEV